MTFERDTERAVRSWLEEGATALPDRVLDAVLDQLPATPQRRPWWPLRLAGRNVYRLAAAAAIVVVTIIAVSLLPALRSPRLTGAVPSGPMTAGRYHIDIRLYAYPEPFDGAPTVRVPSGVARVSFDVPDGWSGTGQAIVKDVPDPSRILSVAPWTIASVNLVPCYDIEGATADPRLMRTLDGLATALTERWRSEDDRFLASMPTATSPTTITLAGSPGRYTEVRAPTDLDFTTCGGDYPLWDDGGGRVGYMRVPGELDRLWILDVADASPTTPGGLLVIDAASYPGATADEVAELRAIVDSIEIELRPAPLPIPARGDLAPGAYFMANPYNDADPVRDCERGCADYKRILFTLPDGWATRDGLVAKHLDQPNEVAFSFWTPDSVYNDGCHWQSSAMSPLDLEGHDHDATGALIPASPGTGGLANQAGRSASAVTEVRLGGQRTLRIELSLPADLDLATCDQGQFRSWSEWDVADGAYSHHSPGQVDVVYLVDVDRRALVIDASRGPAASASDLAELESILASMLIVR